MIEFEKLVENLMDQEKWSEARELLFEAINKYPDEHFLYSRLSTAYYEDKLYEDALKYAEKAYAIEPNDPIVLWDYAGALEMTDKPFEAQKVWKKLLDLGMEKIAYGNYGEGKRWAKSLINDTFYRMSLSSAEVGSKADAIKYMKRHLEGRKPGIPSLYPLKEVRKKAKILGLE